MQRTEPAGVASPPRDFVHADRPGRSLDGDWNPSRSIRIEPQTFAETARFERTNEANQSPVAVGVHDHRFVYLADPAAGRGSQGIDDRGVRPGPSPFMTRLLTRLDLARGAS